MRPVIIARLQRALDKEPAKTGAIDEEIALDQAAVVELQSGQKAVLAPSDDLVDAPFWRTTPRASL